MTGFDAAEVRRLRTEERLSVREIRARTGLGRNRIQEMLRGVPAPERTRRAKAKDDLRAEAVALRSTGRPVPEIARRLGVSRSTAYLWVRHIPLNRDPEEELERRRHHARAMTEARWADHRRARDEAQAKAHAVATTTFSSSTAIRACTPSSCASSKSVGSTVSCRPTG
ncbi:helix-turn-helix domain-containing protein [Micromonospora andamanensis]|nr:helix-turn-helix domain-containing protein [Micromonospora andamanensis]